MDRRRYLESVAVAGSAVILAGCTDGNDEGNGDGETPTSTPTAADDETPTEPGGDGSTATGTETAGETPTAEPPDDPEQRVQLESLQFDPESFEITVGDTVLWEWNEGGHNIKYDEGDVPEDTTWEGTSGSRTTTYGEGHEHWHTFDTAGEYDYYCVPHQSNDMRGSFTVSG